MNYIHCEILSIGLFDADNHITTKWFYDTMKITTKLLIGVAALGATTISQAELTGSLALDYNSHFISYGADVWGAGSDMDDFLFNPSLGFNYEVNDKLSFNAGIWLDVNDLAGDGFAIQETDIWLGMVYGFDWGSVSVTWQNWHYGDYPTDASGTVIGDDTEEVLDLGISLDTFLSPSLTLHSRLGGGAGDGNTGTMAVLSGGYDFAASEAATISFSASVAAAISKFHTDETGYAYTSLGVSASYAVSEVTSIYAGLTYYTTDDDVVGNDDSDFVTINAGTSFSF